ncbi:MAG: hypothetical protein RMJ07_02790, partial [Nitrososphaerota archaeon]|nr:hypothetical protein [Nitrososphaerota archaeon]
RNLYLYGTELPDNGQAPDGIGDTLKHHIYYSLNGTLIDDSAARRANETYQQALNHLLLGNFSAAAKYAGAMTHYIADMAVFGHIMGKNTVWGEETHHSDFEDYVNARTGSYDSEFSAALYFDGELKIISAYEAAVKLAYDTTFDRLGRGLTCLWMDRNYNWSNPTFVGRVGELLNQAVNYVADVLYTLYIEVEQRQVFDFTLSVNPSNISVNKGGNGTALISVGKIVDWPRAVTLSVTDLPPGVSISLSVQSNTPPYTSTLLILISRTAPFGLYNLTITGKCGDTIRTVFLSLIIMEQSREWYEEPIGVAALLAAAALSAASMILRRRRR